MKEALVQIQDYAHHLSDVPGASDGAYNIMHLCEDIMNKLAEGGEHE